MNKKTLPILLIIAILVVIFIGIYTITRQSSENTLTQNKKIPAEVQQLADKYIIDLVGKSEFDRNYEIDYEKSKDCNELVYPNQRENRFQNMPKYLCYIWYKFLPGNKYGGSEYSLFYDGESVSIANNDIPITLPSCEIDLNSCNFLLSLDDLKEIAREENLNDDYFRMVMRDQKILIEVSYCDLNTTENRKKILVDPKNGEILWRGLNEECQGIF